MNAKTHRLFTKIYLSLFIAGILVSIIAYTIATCSSCKMMQTELFVLGLVLMLFATIVMGFNLLKK
jgi:hypothetical protein